MNLRALYIPLVLMLALACASSALRAQSPVATFGTRFTLAIPEGADGLIDPTNPSDSSQLYLMIISHTPGSATIGSPSGYSNSFCYDTITNTNVQIPHSLMLIPGEGKSSKGLVVQTSTPVQLILLDKFTAGGEITQIYPDSALGTEYRIATWGIYDDPGENNRTEFVITAPFDNTNVTIAPAVRPVGRADASPFTISLNAGECYIVKADINALPFTTSLTGSLVTADRPVSVISGLTCGYAPLGTEACNELLNMQLPRTITDTVFYTAPFSTFTGYALMFVSDVPDYFVIDGGGLTYSSTNGVVLIPFTTDQNKFVTTAPAQCYQLSVGYDLTRDGLSDPSLITVPPRSQWTDSLEWRSPDLSDPVFGTPFPNFISVIYPVTAEPQLMLDGVPAASLATATRIPNSPYGNLVIQVPPGDHTLTSPQPIFAFASGFSYADAYSYDVGAMLPPAPPLKPTDTITSLVVFDTLEQPSMCHDFDVAVRLLHTPGDAIEQVHAGLTFDPSFFTYLGMNKGAVALANTFNSTVTASTFTFDLSGSPKITGNDTICILHFHCGTTASGTTSISIASTLSKREPFCQSTGRAFKEDMTIVQFNDREDAAFALAIPAALANATAVGSFSLVVAPADPIRSVQLRLQYDHDLLTWRTVTGGSLVGPNILASPIRNLDKTTDEVTVSFSPQVNQTGELLKLGFDVSVADSASTVVTVSTNISNDRPCPLEIVAPDTSTVFTMRDTCGTSVLRQFLQGIPPSISRIVPNPTTGKVHLLFDRSLPPAAYSIDVTDVLGQHLRHLAGAVSAGSTEVGPIDLGDMPSGIYFLEIDLGGLKCTTSVLVRN